MIKSRMMRWAGYVAHMVDMRNVYKILVESLKGRYHSEDQGMSQERERERKKVGIYRSSVKQILRRDLRFSLRQV
jgi:hypothetical protein